MMTSCFFTNVLDVHGPLGIWSAKVDGLSRAKWVFSCISALGLAIGGLSKLSESVYETSLKAGINQKKSILNVLHKHMGLGACLLHTCIRVWVLVAMSQVCPPPCGTV